jgi:hypothetical protein
MEVRTKTGLPTKQSSQRKMESIQKTPETYSWSFACFYESGIDQFGCLNHYQEFFG